MNGFGIRKARGQYKSSMMPKSGLGVKPDTRHCKTCRGGVIHINGKCRCCKTENPETIRSRQRSSK